MIVYLVYCKRRDIKLPSRLSGGELKLILLVVEVLFTVTELRD